MTETKIEKDIEALDVPTGVLNLYARNLLEIAPLIKEALVDVESLPPNAQKAVMNSVESARREVERIVGFCEGMTTILRGMRLIDAETFQSMRGELAKALQGRYSP
jgi:hypothetical protein